MKLNEFQEKLTTVSEAKLRLMLADSRRKGPEVAVRLILAEAERRGVDLNAIPEPESDGSGEVMDAWAGGPGTSGDAAGEGATDAGLGAGKGAWLTEEANQGMPMFLKILITIAVLAGILAGLVLLLGRQ